MIERLWIERLIAFALAAAMGLVLIFDIPTLELLQSYWFHFFLYLSLTALAVVSGILLSRGEISIAHAVGIIAVLSLPAEAITVTVWAVFLGGILGGVIIKVQRREGLLRYRTVRRTLRNLLVTSSRVTLSFFAAAQLYMLLGSTLPLRVGDSSDVIELFLFSVGYISIYSAVYVIEWYLEEHDIARIVRENWKAIFYALTIPVAYAIPIAVMYTELPIEIFILGIIGLGITILVTSAYSHDQHLLQQQVTEMSSLSTLSRELQADTDTITLIQRMQRHLIQIMEADRVVIAIIKQETKQTHFPLHDDERELPAADVALVERIEESQTPLLIEQHVNAYLQANQLPPYNADVQSLVGVPMLVRARNVGMIILHSMGERRFRHNDLRLLEIVAAAFATALDNAQLYRQQKTRVERLNILNSISVLLSSSLSLESVLDTITTSAAMLADSKAVALYLSEPEISLAWVETSNNSFSMLRNAGLSDAFLNENVPALLQEAAAYPQYDTTDLKEFQPLIVQDVRADERVKDFENLLLNDDILSLIELPLAGNGQLFGVVALYFSIAQTPDAEFIEFLRTFASEAAQAIKNAQLYTRTDEALEKRLVQLSILAAVGQQTNASVDDVDIHSISDTVINSATNYTEVERGAIVLFGSENGEAHVAATYALDENTIPDSDVLQVARTDRILASKAYNGTAFYETENVSLGLVASAQSQLIVPIRRDAQVMGALVLESDADNAFSKDDINFIVQLLSQASIAIDNRLLFQVVMQANDRMQVILDAMVEAIVLINDKAEIELANPAVKNIGLSQEEVSGKNLHSLLQDERIPSKLGFKSADDVHDLMQAFSPSDARVSEPVNYTIQHEHEAQYIERQAIPIRGEHEQVLGLLLVFYDHTKQMQLENTRDEFTRMIVHDLRSPLTAVTTSLYLIRQLIDKQLDNPVKIADITISSEQAIKKMLQRVDSLLDVAKMESGELKLEHDVIAFPDVVNSVFSELQPLAAENNVQLQLDYDNTIPLLNGDIDKVERVVQNLVDNALKYTQNGSSIIVRARPYSKDDNFMQISVIDHGPGIPEQDRERLFDRFVQLSNGRARRRGVGLGLTFCRLVVEAHGGRIWVEENPNGGSVFAFTLPMLI